MPDGLSALFADPKDGLSALFAGLEQAPAIVVAVSGGPDSIALMGMAGRWAASLGTAAPRLDVATVDHGLRAASRGEAEAVAARATVLGLAHAILPWDGPKPATRIQERARAARYRLLAAHARARGATHVLTGHHADDQAETVLLRLTRGSGVAGLAGMRRDTPLAPDLRLVRPLLGLRKAELVAYCRREGLATLDDPSNTDPAYARTRLRSDAAIWASLGLDTPAVLRLAGRMAEADDALEAEATRLEAIVGPWRAERLYRASFDAVRPAGKAVVARLLRRAIDHVVGGARPLPLARLEALSEAVAAALAARHPHGATLGGARIACSSDGTIEVTPEPPRRRGRRTAEASERASGGAGSADDRAQATTLRPD